MDYGMPPHEVGQRFTAKDVNQYLAFHIIQDEERKKAEAEARLSAQATEQRNKVNG